MPSCCSKPWMIFHSVQDLQAEPAPSGQVLELEGLSFSEVFWPPSTVHIPSSIKLKDYHLLSFQVSLEQNVWDNICSVYIKVQRVLPLVWIQD